MLTLCCLLSPCTVYDIDFANLLELSCWLRVGRTGVPAASPLQGDGAGAFTCPAPSNGSYVFITNAEMLRVCMPFVDGALRSTSSTTRVASLPSCDGTKRRTVGFVHQSKKRGSLDPAGPFRELDVTASLQDRVVLI